MAVPLPPPTDDHLHSHGRWPLTRARRTGRARLRKRLCTPSFPQPRPCGRRDPHHRSRNHHQLRARCTQPPPARSHLRTEVRLDTQVPVSSSATAIPLTAEVHAVTVGWEKAGQRSKPQRLAPWARHEVWETADGPFGSGKVFGRLQDVCCLTSRGGVRAAAHDAPGALPNSRTEQLRQNREHTYSAAVGDPASAFAKFRQGGPLPAPGTAPHGPTSAHPALASAACASPWVRKRVEESDLPCWMCAFAGTGR